MSSRPTTQSFLILILVGLLLTPQPLAAQAETLRLPREVPVYPIMSPEVRSVATLAYGTVVTIVDRRPGWIFIRYEGGRQGYLKVADVLGTEPPPAMVQGPCSDSLYQALRQKDLNAMTEREWIIFQERDRACLAHQAAQGQRQPQLVQPPTAPIPRPSTGRAQPEPQLPAIAPSAPQQLQVAPPSVQACTGIPIEDQQVAIVGAVAFGEGARGYGGGFRANLAGPVMVGAGYTLTDYDDIDPNGHSVNGEIAVELPTMGASICPVIGGGYYRISESEFGLTGTISTISAAAGLGIGKTFLTEASETSVTLFAVPQLMHVRAKGEISEGGSSVSETDSTTEFAAVTGIAFGVGQAFFRGDVAFTTVDDSDPVFTLGIGFRVGARR